MELIEKYKWLIVIAGAVVILGGLLTLNSSTEVEPAEDKTQTSENQKKEAEKKKKEAAEAKAKEAATGDTTYTARAGNSYTKIARKAIQAYNDATNSGLSRAQIVAAETFMTVAAGSPELNLGQKVTVDKATVAKFVKKAQALTASEVAAWQVYVPYVNFDTSGVG